MTKEAVLLGEVDTRQRPGYVKLPIGLPRIDKMPTLTSFGPVRVYDMYNDNET